MSRLLSQIFQQQKKNIFYFTSFSYTPTLFWCIFLCFLFSNDEMSIRSICLQLSYLDSDVLLNKVKICYLQVLLIC